MKTLYDILGVSKQATAAQIEQGYKFCLNSLKRENSESVEEGLIRAKALKEAYAVLSSPSRRQAYDQKLKAKEQATYQIVERAEFPWVKVSLVFFLVAGGVYYKIQSDKAESERIAAIEAAKVKIAVKQAEAEEAALERQRLQEQQLAEENRQREMEQARREGLQIHENLQRREAQAAREKEEAERRAAYEKQREEQAAKMRSRDEIYSMERALNIPIRRY